MPFSESDLPEPVWGSSPRPTPRSSSKRFWAAVLIPLAVYGELAWLMMRAELVRAAQLLTESVRRRRSQGRSQAA